MIKQTFTSRGFTLIELLVVIAIIGILASVVLASLNSARDKGADAAIKSNLNNSRAQAELYYDDEGRSYDNVCTSTDGISTMRVAAETAGSASVVCGDTALAWAMSAQLMSDTDQYYCVDSTGVARIVSSSLTGTSDIDCPAS